MYLSNEATNKDKSLKTQLLLSNGIGDDKSADTEKIWDNLSFFRDQVEDFTISFTVSFPKNTLIYVNQGNTTPVKSNLAVYLDCAILEQLVPARNSPENIDKYE